MKYKILKGKELKNTIVADLAFVDSYCEANGYTYEEIPETPETDYPISEMEQLRADVDYIAVMTGVEL